MNVLRLLVFIVIALIPLAAGATTFSIRTDSRIEEGTRSLAVAASEPVKGTTHVSWSYNFPAAGSADAGVLTYRPGETYQWFPISYPQDGRYHPPLDGTLSLSYTHNGNQVSSSWPVQIWYYEPYLRFEDTRAVEDAGEQSIP